jgi:hypothetical protein
VQRVEVLAGTSVGGVGGVVSIWDQLTRANILTGVSLHSEASEGLISDRV